MYNPQIGNMTNNIFTWFLTRITVKLCIYMYTYIYMWINCQKNQWLKYPLIFKKCFILNKIQQLIIITFEVDYYFQNSYRIILTISLFFGVCFGKDYSVGDILLRMMEMVRNSSFLLGQGWQSNWLMTRLVWKQNADRLAAAFFSEKKFKSFAYHSSNNSCTSNFLVSLTKSCHFGKK